MTPRYRLIIAIMLGIMAPASVHAQSTICILCRPGLDPAVEAEKERARARAEEARRKREAPARAYEAEQKALEEKWRISAQHKEKIRKLAQARIDAKQAIIDRYYYERCEAVKKSCAYAEGGTPELRAMLKSHGF